MSRRSRRGPGARGTREQGSQIVCERYDGRESLCLREKKRGKKSTKLDEH